MPSISGAGGGINSYLPENEPPVEDPPIIIIDDLPPDPSIDCQPPLIDLSPPEPPVIDTLPPGGTLPPGPFVGDSSSNLFLPPGVDPRFDPGIIVRDPPLDAGSGSQPLGGQGGDGCDGPGLTHPFHHGGQDPIVSVLPEWQKHTDLID